MEKFFTQQFPFKPLYLLDYILQIASPPSTPQNSLRLEIKVTQRLRNIFLKFYLNSTKQWI